jgi:hypothetical protein
MKHIYRQGHRALALAGLLACNVPVHAEATDPAARLPLATEAWSRETSVGALQVSLYTRQVLANRSDILGAPGEKRLRVQLQGRLSSDQIGRLMLRDIEKTGPAGEFAAHADSLLKMGQAFATRKELAAGHSFGFEFLPGQGTRLLIDEQPAGDFMGGPGFFALVARPWLGGGKAVTPGPTGAWAGGVALR